MPGHEGLGFGGGMVAVPLVLGVPPYPCYSLLPHCQGLPTRWLCLPGHMSRVWFALPIKSWIIFGCICLVLDFWCSIQGQVLCLLAANWKVSGILLMTFAYRNNWWLFKEINGSLEQKCGQSLGRGMGRSSIPSLLKTRGDNGAMERDPLGSRAL